MPKRQLCLRVFHKLAFKMILWVMRTNGDDWCDMRHFQSVKEHNNIRIMGAEKCFYANRQSVANASLTCSDVFSSPCCFLPHVCVGVCGNECISLSLMSLYQPLVRDVWCLPLNVLSLLLLSPSIPNIPPFPLTLSLANLTSAYNFICTCACTHAHPLACHSVGPLISSSLVVSVPSFSAFNTPPFSCSLHGRAWPHLTRT